MAKCEKCGKEIRKMVLIEDEDGEETIAQEVEEMADLPPPLMPGYYKVKDGKRQAVFDICECRRD